jgi:predicted outer membrane repeat protein
MLLVCDAGAWVYSKDCSALGTDYVCQQNGPVAECTENNSSVSDGDTNTDNDPVDENNEKPDIDNVEVEDCTATSCHYKASCDNSSGKVVCTCLTGYSGDGQECEDINECLTSNGGCDENAVCTNTSGSRTCKCNAGYEGDGVICSDINECLTDNGGCGENAVCTNIPESRTCDCKTGFIGDGFTCTDINECDTDNGGCDTNAVCTNTTGSRTCVCNEGYEGSGLICEDINECETDNGGCDQICTNNEGSFECTCNEGFHSYDDGKTCVEMEAPDAISDLVVLPDNNVDQVKLSWTAPGDDGNIGTVTEYVIKKSSSVINAGNFDAADTISASIVPQIAGSTESVTVPLTWRSGTYYIGVKAIDDVGNSSISNIIVADTDAKLDFSEESINFGGVAVGDIATRNITVTNNSQLIKVTLSNIHLSEISEVITIESGGLSSNLILLPGEAHVISLSYSPEPEDSTELDLEITHSENSLTTPSPFIVPITAEEYKKIPEITNIIKSDNYIKDGETVTITIDVEDDDNNLPTYNDIDSAVIDLTTISGSATAEMTEGATSGTDTISYSIDVDTTGLSSGTYFLPVTVTDNEGFTDSAIISITVYTGNVIYVGTGETYTKIQLAINAATDGDIVVIRDGTYAGAGNKNLKLNGKNIAVVSENGAEYVTIDCENEGRGFYFDSYDVSSTVTIQGITIENALLGPVECAHDNCSPVFDEMVFRSNSAPMKISGVGSSVLIINSMFISNMVEQHGGALFVDSDAALNIERASFSYNDADGPSQYYSNHNGGAIYTKGTVVVKNSDFYKNKAGNGGDIYVSYGEVTVDSCKFNESEANNYYGGGSIYSEYSDVSVSRSVFYKTSATYINSPQSYGTAGSAIYAFESTLMVSDSVVYKTVTSGYDYLYGSIYLSGLTTTATISGSKFIGNHLDCSDSSCGEYGAAIYNYYSSGKQGDLTIKNTLFSDNVAEDGGGAIYGHATILNSTIVNNSAKYGGGIYFTNESEIKDSIIWGNTASGSGDNIFIKDGVPDVVISYSNIDESTQSISDAYAIINSGDGYYAGANGNLSVDPKFVTGTFGSYYLASDSQCIDAGSDTAENLGLDGKTTSATDTPDSGVVDLGYHYKISE